MSTQKVIALKTRPQKGVNPVMGQADSTFELKRVSIPTERDLKDGEVIVRVEHCGIEPSMRAWISEARS
jgi:NADPH-dependent curcumin reductase CurA